MIQWYARDGYTGIVRRAEMLEAAGQYEPIRNIVIAQHDFEWLGRVSTIFLPFDPQLRRGVPRLWETMVFGGIEDGFQWRYTSEQDAIRGHLAICRIVLISPVVWLLWKAAWWTK